VRRGGKDTDRLGVALLLGALIGFVIGGVIGFSNSTSLDAPVVWPFAGAAIGVLVTGVIAAVVARFTRSTAARPEVLDPDRFRQRSRQGWVDGIDLASDPPPRPPQREPVLDTRPRPRQRRRPSARR
jgi:hypothetical protein